MHSLKPSGDNIAQEFFRLMGKKGLAKVASLEGDSKSEEERDAERFVSELDTIAQTNRDSDPAEIGLSFASDLEAAMEGQVDESFDDTNLEDMITDTEVDSAIDFGSGDIDAAADALEAMDLALDGHTASEKRVLSGLAKIAGSLRAKGEAFAADVVEATAVSIKGDLQKEAAKRSLIVSSLKKIAKDLYASEDPLAGDMVQVTINKLGGNPFDELEDELDKQKESGGGPQEKLLQWSCVDDARGKKIRRDWTAKAKAGDQVVKMLMMQSKQKCPDVWV
jgi:hypothetical protein